jgi:hypothetical protein
VGRRWGAFGGEGRLHGSNEVEFGIEIDAEWKARCRFALAEIERMVENGTEEGAGRKQAQLDAKVGDCRPAKDRID